MNYSTGESGRRRGVGRVKACGVALKNCGVTRVPVNCQRVNVLRGRCNGRCCSGPGKGKSSSGSNYVVMLVFVHVIVPAVILLLHPVGSRTEIDENADALITTLLMLPLEKMELLTGRLKGVIVRWCMSLEFRNTTQRYPP